MDTTVPRGSGGAREPAAGPVGGAADQARRGAGAARGGGWRGPCARRPRIRVAGERFAAVAARQPGTRAGGGIAPARHPAHSRPGHGARPEVGGIPVDSEYVIFILDTSGSMKRIWDEVMNVMGRVLDIHPKVSGFQVLNDNGAYLVSGYRQRWIRDTPRLRASIRNALRNWGAMSNSSPVEGLQTALRHVCAQGGEDCRLHLRRRFPGRVLRPGHGDVARPQRRHRHRRSRVRVHAVGFVSTQIHDRYATLMREVTRNHDGAFLALPVQGAGG